MANTFKPHAATIALALLMAFTTPLLTACSDDDNPDEFIGTWKAYSILYQAYDADDNIIWEYEATSGVTWYFYSSGKMQIIAAPVEIDTDAGSASLSSTVTMTETKWSYDGQTLTFGDTNMTVTSFSSSVLTVEGYQTEGNITLFTSYAFYKAA